MYINIPHTIIINCFIFKMTQKRKITPVLYLLNLIIIVSSGPQQKWTFEIMEISTYTSDPNILELGGSVVRIGRGVYGFSGFWNLKEDFGDDVLVQASAQRSQNRNGPYFKIPMGIDNETLSSAMNKYYKPHVQPVSEKCCTNAPVIKDKFVPPLTKRNAEAKNCEILTDNLPNVVMPGYYKVRVTLVKPGHESYAEGLFFVENLTN